MGSMPTVTLASHTILPLDVIFFLMVPVPFALRLDAEISITSFAVYFDTMTCVVKLISLSVCAESQAVHLALCGCSDQP